MEKMKLSPPWVTYANEVKELFRQDENVTVLFDLESMELKLYVSGDRKAAALGRLFPAEKTFGNVKLSILVVPSNDNEAPSFINDVKAAFEGNEAVSFISDETTPFGEIHYVVFHPEVVQFWNDDMSDINGNRTTLYHEIARDVIGQQNGVYFCSDEF